MAQANPTLQRGLSPARDRRISPYVATFPPGSFTWTCPKNGWYRLVGWGADGAGNGGGGYGPGSGAHVQKVAYLAQGQSVAVVIAAAGDTSFTLPNGAVITASGGSGQNGGTAAGGDINLNGSAGGNSGASGAAGLGNAGGAGGANAGSSGGGAGQPGYGPYRGAAGLAGNATGNRGYGVIARER